jgi:DNA repair protein RecO (recombination protein O)
VTRDEGNAADDVLMWIRDWTNLAPFAMVLRSKGLSVSMKDTTSPAVIMRVREFGESDLLATFFTPDRGQLKGVAKAGRRSRKRFANCLETFSLVSLEYGTRREGGLCLIHSGRLINGFHGLRSDFGTLSKASYMIELTEVLFPVGVADREMFELLRNSLELMAENTAPDRVLLLFEARALALGGYAIRTERCCVCGRTYTGRGTAVFKRETGEIACLRCQRESALTPPMRPESVRALEKMQKARISGGGVPDLPEEVAGEIRAVIRIHREYRLEHRLKTLKYVE